MTELSRMLPLDRLASRGTEFEVVADAPECVAVAARLGLPAVISLSCRFALTPRADDPAVVQAEGRLLAEVVQDCVVTLEPFEAPVQEDFRVRFVPAGRETWDDDPDSDDEIPYEGRAIDLGEAAVEQLALALDPFPRKPGAVLDGPLEDAPGGPFAALAARRRRA